MKHYLLTIAMMTAIMVSSCGTEDDENVGRAQGKILLNADSIKTHKVITFDLSRADITHEAMTRATLTELNMTDLWIFDYVGDELQQTVHETSDLASATLSLDYGSHTLYFVASRGTTPSVSPPTISWEKPSDTFWASLAINVEPSTSSSQNVAMVRVATRMRVIPTDVLTATTKKLSVTPAHWYYGLNIKTGEAADDRSTTRTIDIPDSYAGTSGTLAASFFGLSNSTEFITDVTVKLLGASDNVLGSVDVPGVSFARNRVTIFSGGVLNAGKVINITADDSWLDDHNQTW